MNRAEQLDAAEKKTRDDLIQYWCEVAALNATEAGTCFGYGKYRDGHNLLMKALYASYRVRKMRKWKSNSNGDKK